MYIILFYVLATKVKFAILDIDNKKKNVWICSNCTLIWNCTWITKIFFCTPGVTKRPINLPITATMINNCYKLKIKHFLSFVNCLFFIIMCTNFYLVLKLFQVKWIFNKLGTENKLAALKLIHQFNVRLRYHN